MNNELIPVSEFECPPSKIDRYRQLGVILILNCYMNGEPYSRQFGESYSELYKCLENGTLFLLLSPERAPQAYAIWRDTGEGEIQITDLIAPFGDLMELIKQLQLHLKGNLIQSIHPRISNRIKIACST